MLNTKVENGRAECDLLAELRARLRAEQQHGDAPAIGSQISTLKMGHIHVVYSPPHQPTDQRGEPDDHRERVVIEVSGLRLAEHAGQHADGLRAAVDERRRR